MNILVVAHYQGDGSPCAIFVTDQVKAYTKLGHKVIVIVPIAIAKVDYQGKRLSSVVKSIDIEGVHYVFVRYLSLSRFGWKSFNTYQAIQSIKSNIAKIVGSFNPNIIQAHTLGFDSEIGYWLKKEFSCPLVVTTHGSDTFLPIKNGFGCTLKQSAEKADTIVCVSSKIKSALSSLGVRVPVKVILNGFDIYKHESKMNKDPLTINQTSNLIKQKRIDVTILAFAMFLKKHPKAKLSIVGKGPLKKELSKLCEEKGVSSSVRFVGKVANSEVQRIMSLSKFFIMVSEREGFGIVYLEAMAAGCITIGTEGEGISDLIQNGVNGFLVPANNPQKVCNILEWCLANPFLAEEIAERGRNDATRLTWEYNASQYGELFNKLLESKN